MFDVEPEAAQGVDIRKLKDPRLKLNLSPRCACNSLMQYALRIGRMDGLVRVTRYDL